MRAFVLSLLVLVLLGVGWYFWQETDEVESVSSSDSLSEIRDEPHSVPALPAGFDQVDPEGGLGLDGLAPSIRARISSELQDPNELRERIKSLLDDPRAAAAFLAENHLFVEGEGEDFRLVSPANINDLVLEVVLAWIDGGGTNGEIVEWARLLDPGLHDLAVGPLVMWRGEEDAAGFAAALSKMPPSAIRDRALLQSASYWAERDPSELREWLEKANLDPTLAGLIVEQGSDRLDPGAVGLEKLNSLTELAGSIDRIEIPDLARSVGQWAETDPTAALEWVNQLEPGSRQEVAVVEEVARKWFQKDEIATEQWLSAMEEGPARDRGIESMLREAGRKAEEGNFSRLLEWTRSIDNPRIAERSRDHLLMSKVRSDPDAVRTYLEENTLSGELRTILEEDLTRVSGKSPSGPEEEGEP